jgi:23S rRNA pseudouridine2605 synthase
LKTRLQKYLAEAGLGSRRGCEAAIRAGRVTVNGRVVDQLGTRVEPGADAVAVDGKAVRPRRQLHVALHKPPGYVCSRQGQGQQRLVGELLPAEWSHLYPVGRLDRETRGLLFLTNDGVFCLRLTHPVFAVQKHYVATVAGKVDRSIQDRLCGGVRDQGHWLRAVRARVVSANATRSVVELDLAEGRNREVRRLCSALGLDVLDLVRTAIGPIRLGELPEGRYRVLTPAEVTTLLDSAGAETAPAGRSRFAQRHAPTSLAAHRPANRSVRPAPPPAFPARRDRRRRSAASDRGVDRVRV